MPAPGRRHDRNGGSPRGNSPPRRPPGRWRSAPGAGSRALRSDLRTLEGKLAALNPTAVLTRGYAIALDRDTGMALRSVSQARPGLSLDIRVSDGEFGAVVTERKT